MSETYSGDANISNHSFVLSEFTVQRGDMQAIHETINNNVYNAIVFSISIPIKR